MTAALIILGMLVVDLLALVWTKDRFWSARIAWQNLHKRFRRSDEYHREL